MICTTIQSVHDTTTLTRGDQVRFIEEGIESGGDPRSDAATGTNAVTVQTIHSVKDLEYPIVILANMNDGKFPLSGGRNGRIVFDERFGLRQRKVYGEDHGQPHIYENWRWDVLRCCRPRDQNEERRLLYVAITRAKDHLVFSAGEEMNTFLEELPVEVQEIELAIEELELDETVQTRFNVSIPEPDGPVGYSHTLIDERRRLRGGE